MFSRLSSQKESREFSATIFLFRWQWGSFSRSFSWSFARIGLLFIKWRRVEHKAACAWTFVVRLARAIPCAAVYKLRFTLEIPEKIYIYVSHSFLCFYNTRERERERNRERSCSRVRNLSSSLAAERALPLRAAFDMSTSKKSHLSHSLPLIEARNAFTRSPETAAWK